MQCDYFDAGRCRSCTLMGQPYPAQLARKQAAVAQLLAGHVDPAAWADPTPSVESGFRNRAKLVVGGRAGDPTLGILDEHRRGVDLERCGLHEPGLLEAVPVLSDYVAWLGLEPYDVPARRGELKYVLATHSPDGELMVRFVLRSEGDVERLRSTLPNLRVHLPTTRVVTANIHPAHKATLEGETEHILTDDDTLPIRVNDITLNLRPRSFFQTNTPVAAALYRRAQALTDGLRPSSVWDLYCGVGGFALHLARPGRQVVGVELAPDAVRSASDSAAALALDARFVTGDATSLATTGSLGPSPGLVVVNPPRRGLGPELAGWLDASDVPHALYSSCNADSLARDLSRMPSWRVAHAELFDMFPQTDHHEVLVQLARR